MGCITLLSDLGTADASIASVKGILMQQLPNTPLIDISNHVEPFYTQQAAYLLASSYYNFPKHSTHLVLFDLFKQKKPTLLLTQKDDQYILAPDNGILPLAFNDNIKQVWKCHEFEEGVSLLEWVKKVAQIIKDLGEIEPASLNFQHTEFTNIPKGYKPVIVNGAAECQVIHIDRFENVIVNITKEEFDRIRNGRSFYIEFVKGETINNISKHYNSVKNGEKLCRFNSSGYLEIAVNRGNAAGLFGLSMKKEQQLIYKTIKIYFE